MQSINDDLPSAESARTSRLEVLLAVLLGLIVVVTFSDVIGRYALNSPLPAAYEITELCMGILVFGGLVSVTKRNDHLRVDLLDRYFGGRVNVVRQYAVDFGSTVALAVFAWQLGVRAVQTFSDHAQTQLLGLSTTPFIASMALLTAIAAICQGLLLFRRSPEDTCGGSCR